MSKSILKSKTFWINIAVGATIAIPGLGLPLSEKVQIWILAGTNIVLRAVTYEKVNFKK